MVSPEDILDQATSRDGFLRFVDALAIEFRAMKQREAEAPSSPYGPSAYGWENVSVDSFLEAMAAWTRDADVGDAPDWHVFAQLMRAGKSYE